MKIIKLTLLMACLGVCFCSCRQNKDKEYATKAQTVADNDPKRALAILDSVKKPEQMDREDYMSYIVTRTQAKYKDYQDITLDSAIVRAAAYFDSSRNPDRAAQANYYAACYYDDKSMPDSSMLYYTKAIKYAEKVKDPVLIGESYHSIASLYLDTNNGDSAFHNYIKALDYYEKVNNATLEIKNYKLEVILQLAKIKNIINNNEDISLEYSMQGLELANRINNLYYISNFNLRLGIISENTGKYNDANNYYHKALVASDNKNDSITVYLNLAILNKQINNSDSTAYYLNIVEKNLPKIEDIETQESANKLLSQYYEYTGDYKKALHYGNLETELNKKLATQKISNNLSKVVDEYRNTLKENRLKQKQENLKLFIWIGVLVFFLIIGVLIIYFRMKSVKLSYKLQVKQNTLLQQQYDKKVESINNMQQVYKNLIIDWIAIDKEVNELAREYGTEEKPTLYTKIQSLIANIRKNTDLQFIDWVKELLKEDGYVGTVIGFGRKEYLLMGFCYCKCPDEDMSKLLALPKSKINQKKLKIKEKLLKRMVPEARIDELLFYNKK